MSLPDVFVEIGWEQDGKPANEGILVTVEGVPLTTMGIVALEWGGDQELMSVTVKLPVTRVGIRRDPALSNDLDKLDPLLVSPYPGLGLVGWIGHAHAIRAAGAKA